MPEDARNLSQEELWKRLNSSNSGSLLKKHLTPTVYNKIKDKVTSFGGTLADCIRSGKFHLGSFGLFIFIL